MATYFWIRKQISNINNYCNLISSSIPSKNRQNGYIYRPALRMQFVPFYQTNTNGFHFYPNQITIMKQTDYICDIANQNVEVICQIPTTESNTTTWVNKYSSSSSESSSSVDNVKSFVFDINVADSSTIQTQHGIVFNQIVAYQKLYFKIVLSVKSEQFIVDGTAITEPCLIENITCYQTQAFSETPLYSCQHIVAKISDFSDLTIQNLNNSELIDNICQLRYNAKVNDSFDSPIYATIYRNKKQYFDFIKTNEITTQSNITSTTRITINFPNFKSANSLNINYESQYRTLQFYDCNTSIGNSNGTWIDDGSFSYYTRVEKSSDGFYKDQKLGVNNDAVYQQAASIGVSYEQFVPSTDSNFVPNVKNDNINVSNKKFVVYWDYLKKNSSNYVINNIDSYLEENIIFKIDFKVKNNNDSTQLPVCYYKYAFSHFIDNQNRVGENISLRKIFDQNGKYIYRQFLVNEKNNTYVGNELIANGFSKFIKDPQYLYCNAKIYENNSSTASDSSSSIDNSKNIRICKYRYSQSQFNAEDDDLQVKWLQIDDFSNSSQIKNANIKINFAQTDDDNNIRQIYLQVADNQFNYSRVVVANMQIYTIAPQSPFLKIVGTNGNYNYTGVEIDSVSGQFSLDNTVKIQFSASTPNTQVNLYYSITGEIYDQYIEEDSQSPTGYKITKLSEYKLYDANDNFKTIYLKPLTRGTNQSYSNSFYDEYNVVQNGQNSVKKKSIVQGCLDSYGYNDITVTFKDDAGNTSSKTQRIYYNTVIFKAQHRNLRQATASYDLQLYKNVNNANTLINRTDNSQAKEYRKWNDIFYPSNHSYPTLINGQIDEDMAIAVSKNYDAYRQQYDNVRVQNNQIVKDTQGRVQTIWDSSKKYPTMVSSYDDLKNQGTGFTYWIIDNTSYGDITLNFEYFYLDNVAYGPPYNQMLGKNTPDVLAIYDASQAGCVQQYSDEYGNIKYKLKDTTKLKRLQRYTGYGEKVMSIDTGTVNATTQGAFTTQSFGTQRICLIFYSDCMNSDNTSNSVIGSGFKLKAAKKIIQYWQNFDIDVNNGLIWTHLSEKASSDGKTPGQALTKASLTYDYYNTSVKIDYQSGSVIFDEKPENDVYASYIYYDYDKDDIPPSRDFMTNADDLVDYADLNVYFVNRGVTPNKINNVNPAPIYPNTNTGQQVSYNDGKLNNNYSVDKDRGIIQFNDASGKDSNYNQFTYVPRGRLFADYRYHTFQRLGNDGYSDFQFNDLILVADRTTKYPDYTWGDIKIVNQGDASLQAGQIKFLARGVVENNTVTQVLDINRPWDVQMGTAQETYGKTGCVIKSNYTWNSYSCTRQQAKDILGSNVVNRFNVDQFKPRGVMYGRIVICLGGTNDSYPTTTAGKKVFSSQIAGKYYQQE